MKVAIIVGHSYKSQGACSSTGESEYTYNSKLASQLAYELHKRDIQPVILFRNQLSSLPTEVNNTNADYAISLHANAYNTAVSGSEVLYWHTSTKGKELALKAQNAITGCLQLRDRGIKPIKGTERGGLILRDTAMPCILIEPFFIDNQSDFDVAEEKLEDLAQTLAKIF